MGKPNAGNTALSHSESIGVLMQTQGSETSQYLEEKKSTEIPLVVASERGTAQTDCSNTLGVVGLSQGAAREVIKPACSRRSLERPTREGDSPVDETHWPLWRQFPSTAGHE